MKKTFFSLALSLSILTLAGFGQANVAHAEATQTGTGAVEFQGEYNPGLRDPENPGTIVDPGPSPSTTGDLRLDFVPQFNFWAHSTTATADVYYGNAQLFRDDTSARGNYVQVSDYRGTGKGWLLQVRQETQFRNESAQNKELKGAVISLDQSWASSTRDSKEAPLVSKDVIKIDNIGQTYNLAEAKAGTGQGTWLITFGASTNNKQGLKETLSPRVDSEGNPFVDPDFDNKTVYENSALNLTIPTATKKDPVSYQTVISWILSELP